MYVHVPVRQITSSVMTGASCGFRVWAPPPGCVLRMLYNITHVNTMSLTTFYLSSIVLSRTIHLLINIPNTISTTLLPLEIL